MAKEGSEIIPIGDIGAVAEQGDRDDKLWVINNVTVAGVPYFDTYKSCLQCKARVEPHTERLGKCSKCMMMQRFDICTQHTTVKLMLLYDDDGEKRTVFAFAYGETVCQIGGSNDVSVEELMESGNFKSMTLKDKDIIKDEYYSHYNLPIYFSLYITIECYNIPIYSSLYITIEHYNLPIYSSLYITIEHYNLPIYSPLYITIEHYNLPIYSPLYITIEHYNLPIYSSL